MKYSNSMRCHCGNEKKYKNCCKEQDETLVEIVVMVESSILLGEDFRSEKEEFYKVLAGDNIETDIDVRNQSIKSTSVKQVKSKTLRALDSKIINMYELKDKFDVDSIAEIEDLTTDIQDKHNRIVAAINVLLNIGKVDGNLLSTKRLMWTKSSNDNEWNYLPMSIKANIESPHTLPLSEINLEIISGYLKEGWKPFIAMEYLYRAKTSSNSKFKWIDATIAAELAIKEFYIRAIPKIEILITKMPSPPIHILYGDVLESFYGVKSPKLKEIREGATKRNSLIHSPVNMEISNEEAVVYVEDIEIAIIHLFSLLYSEDDIYVQFMRDKSRAVLGQEVHIAISNDGN